MTNSKVRTIKLKNKPEALDFLFKKEEEDVLCNNMPDQRHYFLIPEKKSQLRIFVRDVTWNAVKKKLTVCIDETSKISVVDWITDMPKGESLTLIFLSQNYDNLGSLRFTGLSVVDHMCNLYTPEDKEPWDENLQVLRHLVEIDYQHLETGVIGGYDYPDQEWQLNKPECLCLKPESQGEQNVDNDGTTES